jgi:ketosteroid isomerase-like protein
MSNPHPTWSPDQQIIKNAYDAFARGDIDAAVADLHPDVEWIEPASFPMGGPYHGRAAVHAYLSASRASWRDLNTDVTLHIVNGKILAVHHLVGVLLDGTPNEATVADVFTVRNGSVVHMQAYATTEEAFATEASPHPGEQRAGEG